MCACRTDLGRPEPIRAPHRGRPRLRGGDGYGVNDYTDSGDGTVTDVATGLTWTQNDNGEAVDWGSALDYCEALSLGGSDAWRLPNIKELQDSWM